MPFQEAKSSAAEMIFNTVFYAGCFLGLLFFHTGLSGLDKTSREPEKMLLMLGGFIAADPGIFALLAHLAGFPAAVGIKDIILYWPFVFASLALYLRDEKTPKKAAGKGAVLTDNFMSNGL